MIDAFGHDPWADIPVAPVWVCDNAIARAFFAERKRGTDLLRVKAVLNRKHN